VKPVDIEPAEGVDLAVSVSGHSGSAD
jgi:hypothetical protein